MINKFSHIKEPFLDSVQAGDFSLTAKEQGSPKYSPHPREAEAKTEQKSQRELEGQKRERREATHRKWLNKHCSEKL